MSNNFDAEIYGTLEMVIDYRRERTSATVFINHVSESCISIYP